MTRGIAVWCSVVAAAMAAWSCGPARAWTPDRPIEIVVGTDPGSGFDRTARILQKIWQTNHLVEQPVTVVNKPGGFGALSWAYLNLHRRAGTYLAIISPLVLTDNLSGNMAMTFRDLTPLTVLEDEEIVTAVFTASPVKDGPDMLERLRRDPASISFGVSGIGGQNHLALALLAQAAGGIDVTKLKVVGFAGSGDVVTSVIGGHVDGTASPASTVAPQVQAGRMRGLGVSADTRLAGPLASTPTWKEQGVDSTFSNWRGLIGPGGMTADQVAYWNGVFARTVETEDWKAEVAREQLAPHYLDSTATAAFLAAQETQLAGVMRKLGLAK